MSTLKVTIKGADISLKITQNTYMID